MSDTDDIRAIVRAINRAWIEGRADDLANYFHADMVIRPPGGAPPSKGRAACIDSYKQFIAAAAIEDYAEGEIEADVWGDTAVASYGFDMAWEMAGAHYREPGRDLFVFTREDGRWQAVWRTLLPVAEGS